MFSTETERPEAATSTDPYSGNLLVQGLGPILSREEILKGLKAIPKPPRNVSDIPKHERLHILFGNLLDLHVPDLTGAQLVQSLDLVLRQGYRFRNPQNSRSWQPIFGAASVQSKTPRTPALGVSAIGIPGVGKTQGVLRALSCYPRQVIPHEHFPRYQNGLNQVVWLTTDVPASGKASDLAENLGAAWDAAMAKTCPDYEPRFQHFLGADPRRGLQMLNEWCQVARGHFLGVLHLDEVQNFFHIPTIERRRKRTGKDGALELSINEDKCLKWILNFMNSYEIPLVLSGTPDGMSALGKRMSNTQRMSTGGVHLFNHYANSDDPEFSDVFLPELARHQYVKHKLPVNPELQATVIEWSGGVKRIIVALWLAAHKVAFERKADDLRLEDFKQAALTYLAPLLPAIAALRSGKPDRLAQFEDLIHKENAFWTSLWTGIGR